MKTKRNKNFLLRYVTVNIERNFTPCIEIKAKESVITRIKKRQIDILT